MNTSTNIVYLYECRHPAGLELGYMSETGHTLKREFGKTSNGNNINGQWVLRAPDGSWLDVDSHRTDVAERHNMKIYFIK